MKPDKLQPSRFVRGTSGTERKPEWLRAAENYNVTQQNPNPLVVHRLSKLKFLTESFNNNNTNLFAKYGNPHPSGLVTERQRVASSHLQSMSKVLRSHIHSVAPNEKEETSFARDKKLLEQSSNNNNSRSEWNEEEQSRHDQTFAGSAFNAAGARAFTIKPLRHTLITKKEDDTFLNSKFDSSQTRAIFTSFSSRRRVQSEQKFRTTRTKGSDFAPSTTGKVSTAVARKIDFEGGEDDSVNTKHNQLKLDLHKLRALITQAKMFKRRVINVFHIVREGIRWRLRHCFVEVSASAYGGSSISEELASVLKQIRSGLAYKHRTIYLFHLNREPISSLSEIHRKEYSVFVDRLPKIELGLDMYFQLNQQIAVAENTVKQVERELGALDDEELNTTRKKKQEQNLTFEEGTVDIDDMVDQLIEDPETAIEIPTASKTRQQFQDQLELSEINDWYEKGDKEYCAKQSAHSTAPTTYELKSMLDERTDATPLSLARLRLEKTTSPFFEIHNPHKHKPHPLTILMETIQHQNPPPPSDNVIQKNVEQLAHREKAVYRELLRKNRELFTQNIPHIIQKYKVTRADAHHLFNLYKSLEQISAVRLKKRVKSVLQSGVDKKTFTEGLRGLGINISDEIVKNICHFDNFINWPHFLKIMSISASKTPQEKLTAILKFVKDNQHSDYLSKTQLENLVTASLKRFLGSTQDQGFFEMRDYFMQIILKDVDTQGTGRVEVDKFKDRILKNRGTNDLVSFLFLAEQG